MHLQRNADLQHQIHERSYDSVELKTEETEKWLLKQAEQLEPCSPEYNVIMLSYWKIRTIGNQTDENAQSQFYNFELSVKRDLYREILSL